MSAIEGATVNLRTMADAELYFRLVARIVVTESGCWEWQGCRSPAGYGGIQIDGQKVGTHRAMWQAARGQLGKLYVCHRCDNPPCINPDHLFAGTAKDNACDRQRKGRSASVVGEMNGAARFSNATADGVVRRLVAGEKVGVVAKELGASPATLKQWMRKRGIWLERKGERNGRAKLTERDIKGIRDRLALGESQMSISRLHGVSGHVIWRIANGKGWL